MWLRLCVLAVLLLMTGAGAVPAVDERDERCSFTALEPCHWNLDGSRIAIEARSDTIFPAKWCFELQSGGEACNEVCVKSLGTGGHLTRFTIGEMFVDPDNWWLACPFPTGEVVVTWEA